VQELKGVELEKIDQTQTQGCVSEVRATLYVPAFTLEGFALLSLIPPDRQYKDTLVPYTCDAATPPEAH